MKRMRCLLSLAAFGAQVGCFGPKVEPTSPPGTQPEASEWVLFSAREGDIQAEPLPPETLSYYLRPSELFSSFLYSTQEAVLQTRLDALRLLVTRLDYTTQPPPPVRPLLLRREAPRTIAGNFANLRVGEWGTLFVSDGRRVFRVPRVEAPQTLAFSAWECLFADFCGGELLEAVPPDERPRVAAFLRERFGPELESVQRAASGWGSNQNGPTLIALFREREGLGAGGFDATCWERLRPQLPALPSAERWASIQKTGEREVTLTLRNPTQRPLEIRGTPFFTDTPGWNALALPGPVTLEPGESRAFTYRATPNDGGVASNFRLRQVLYTPEGPCLFEGALDFPRGTSFTPSFRRTFVVLGRCPPDETPEPLPPDILRVSFPCNLHWSDGAIPALRFATECPEVRLMIQEGRFPALSFDGERLVPKITYMQTVKASGDAQVVSVEGALPPEEIDRPTTATLELFLRDEAGKLWSLKAEHTPPPRSRPRIVRRAGRRGKRSAPNAMRRTPPPKRSPNAPGRLPSPRPLSTS